MVATHHSVAIAVMLFTRPQRSASSAIGNEPMPTISATMLTSEPSCRSVSDHSAFSIGNTALITLRVR
jgi:hypothetical protein